MTSSLSLPLRESRTSMPDCPYFFSSSFGPWCRSLTLPTCLPKKPWGIYWPLHTESLLLCLLPPVWCHLWPSWPSSSPSPHVGVVSGLPGPPPPMSVSSPALLALFLLLPCWCCLRPSWPSSHRLRPSQSSSSRVSVASGPPSPLFCNR